MMAGRHELPFISSFLPSTRCSSVSSSPETAAPFPQRWGLLRKGRVVFRREACFDGAAVARKYLFY